MKRSEKYKNVYFNVTISQGKYTYEQWEVRLMIRGNLIKSFFKDELSAARFVDLKRIEHGLEPINVLKRK